MSLTTEYTEHPENMCECKWGKACRIAHRLIAKRPFIPDGFNPPKLASDWLGVGGVPLPGDRPGQIPGLQQANNGTSPREACAAKPEICGVGAPRPQNSPVGFVLNAPEIALRIFIIPFVGSNLLATPRARGREQIDSQKAAANGDPPVELGHFAVKFV